MTKRPRNLKRWAWTAAALLVASQLVPVDRTNPPVETEAPAPEPVRAVLRRACYDCHSNQTVWPWYSRVAPVSWLVSYDVHHGREHLNFSTWNRLTPAKATEIKQKVWEQVSEGEMPLTIYRPLHPDAALSAEDKAILEAWSRQ